jgi:DUF1365 family protein
VRSCLYEGFVTHVRRTPFEHSFRNRLMLPYLDLDELPEVLNASRLWAAERRAPASFRRSDHFGDSAEPLAATVRNRVEAETGRRPSGPIGLLTHPRYFGYVFNPVSFFYCWDRLGDALDAVVAEVTNTPWGERHCYVIQGAPSGSSELHGDAAKALHVSPFLDMRMDHSFRLGTPGEKLRVEITNVRDAQPLFTARLALERRPFTSRNLARAVWRYPLLTAQIHAAIHWQAFRLWLRGAPFFSHPTRPREATSS